MEGGLLEARQGNTAVARKVLNFLVSNVPWFGPIYQEACRFEEKCEEYENALRFVEKGLQENSRYGPLWFSALRLKEKLMNEGKSAKRSSSRNDGSDSGSDIGAPDKRPGSTGLVEKENGYMEENRPSSRNSNEVDLSAIEETIEEAMKCISRELIWKLYFEAAQIYERAHSLERARAYYVHSVSYCPNNLLWKVWLGGARTELNFGNVTIARKLLKRALREVPLKMKVCHPLTIAPRRESWLTNGVGDGAPGVQQVGGVRQQLGQGQSHLVQGEEVHQARVEGLSRERAP